MSKLRSTEAVSIVCDSNGVCEITALDKGVKVNAKVGAFGALSSVGGSSLSLLLLVFLGLFVYGFSLEMLLRFLGFTVIVIASTVMVALGFPVFAFFIPKYYNALLNFTGITSTWLSLTVYILGIVIGAIEFFILAYILISTRKR